jgi:hypothetical protein
MLAMKLNNKQLQIMSWLAVVIVSLMAVVVWGSSLNWKLNQLTAYGLFPLFGLLAFSIMWSHYMSSVVRQHFGLEKKVLARYFEITSLLVLFFILLHPAILIWQLWSDGLGLPPQSYLNLYEDPKFKGAVMLGTLSLPLFLAYELRRKFSGKNWWKYISYGTDVGMVAIFLHASRLGTHVQAGWFRYVWIFYGITLLVFILYIHVKRLTKPRGDKVK